MDSHTDSAQVRRLEVVQTGRRRRWSDDEKLRIVLESLQGPRQASSTARRHGISPSLLFTWRQGVWHRAERCERRPASCRRWSFRRRGSPASQGRAGAHGDCAPGGGRVIVDAGVDPAALARVLDVLERR